MKQVADAKVAILRKLYVMKKIGEAHTPLENIQKSFPKHFRGEVNKKIIPVLVKESFIILKKHNYGIGVSLNPKRIREIRDILKRNFPEFLEF